MKPSAVILICMLSLHAVCYSDDRLADPIRVVKVSSPPIIDGILDEPIWKEATVVSDFKQRSPVEAAEPTERTDVLLVYSTNALFIGVHAFDSQPEGIAATVLKRDDFDITQNDQFVIAIDTYNDGRNGYWFSSNPLGARVDAQFFNEGDIFETNWDGPWRCQAHITEDGWTLEIEIPFSTMRFNEAPDNIMGINLFRRIIRTNEALFSPLIPLRYANGTPNVSAARKYLFTGINGGTHLFLKPYVASGVGNDDYRRARGIDNRNDLGIDLRYSLADNLTANLSYNTDFAQADVDERRINLTRYSLFVPEKRDFFLENAGSFSFGLTGETEVFFSRRIGLAEDSTGAMISVPILIGAKLTGRLGGFEIGLLDVQARSSGDVNAENFGAFRFKHGIGSRSYAGGILTGAHSGTTRNGVLGLDCMQFLTEDVVLSIFAAMSASSFRRSDIAHASATFMSLSKSGEEVSFNVGMLDVGSRFDPSIGFVPRSDIRKWNSSLSVPWYVQSVLVRRLVPGYEFVSYEDHRGEIQNSLHRTSIRCEFQSDDQITLFLERPFESVPSNFSIFRNVSIVPGMYRSYDGGLEVVTKQGRPLAASLAVGAGEFYSGSRFHFNASVQYKASRHLTLTGTYESNHISLGNAFFVTRLVRSRIAFSLNTRFSVATLVQYDNASEQLGFNVRLAYQFDEGTECFLIFNEILDNPSLRESGVLGTLRSVSLLLKLSYQFTL